MKEDAGNVLFARVRRPRDPLVTESPPCRPGAFAPASATSSASAMSRSYKTGVTARLGCVESGSSGRWSDLLHGVDWHRDRGRLVDHGSGELGRQQDEDVTAGGPPGTPRRRGGSGSPRSFRALCQWVMGSSGRVPFAIPLPDVQGVPRRFGRRQRQSRSPSRRTGLAGRRWRPEDEAPE